MNLSDVQKKLIMLFIVLGSISGIIGVISSMTGIHSLRLWKEFFIGLLFVISITSTKMYYPKRLLNSCNTTDRQIKYLTLIFMSFFILEGIYSHFLPLNLIIYQYKIDVPIVLFLIACWNIISRYNKDELLTFSRNIIRILLITGVFNAIAIALERFFPNAFVSMIGTEMGNWGEDSGVKIVVTGTHLRSIGLLTNFVSSGTFMFICFVLLVETKNLLNIKKVAFALMAVIYVVSIYFTTYKTAMIGLTFYLVIKLIPYVFKSRTNLIEMIYSLLVFAGFFISTHFYFIYHFVNHFSKSIAYNSIFLRVEQHQMIIHKLSSFPKFVFGLGAGKNGMFGIDKASYGVDPIATDSTYIYLVSNYGYLSILIFIGILIFLLNYLYTNKARDIFGSRYIILFIICIEFFYNNFFANFPVNLFIILVIILSLSYIRQGLISIENQKRNNTL